MKRTILEPVQPSGAMLKLWRKVHTHTGPLPDYTQEETQLLPAVISGPLPGATQPPVILADPQYVEYRSSENPLVLLYGGCIKCIEKCGRPPTSLYLSPIILPKLLFQHRHILSILYDARYRYWHKGEVLLIPIRGESELPRILKIAMNGSIPRDVVIALAA